MSYTVSEELLKVLEPMEDGGDFADKKNDGQSDGKDVPNFDTFLMQALIDPEASTKTLHNIVEKYKPLLYGICTELQSMLKDLTNNDEWYTTNARNYKQYYDAYMNAGFTEDQAFALVVKDSTVYSNITKSISSSAKKSRSSK